MGNSPPCITMVEKNEGTEIIFTCVNGQSFLLEISSKTEQVLFQKKITVNPKEEIVWNCLDYSGEIIARIIDNSNNQKKVAATSHFQIREKKTTIVKNGITLTRTSPPYCDYPQTISFSRENGIQSGDYLACFLDDRKGWDWCRSNQEITFTCATSLKTMIVRMIYYQNGSWCSRGTPIAELNYPLINPMKEFTLSKPSLTVTEKISIHFESYRPLHNCQMIATFQEVEIESVPISSEICEGDYTSSAPRLPGLLTISCIAASCRNGEIATRQIQVCNSPTIIPMELFFQNAPKDRKLQSFTVNEPFTVSTTGSFLRVETDQLLMIPTNDLSFIPETKDLQDSLLQSSAINPLGSTFQLEKVGMYLIILVHLHNGKRLYADSCMVVIVKDHPLNAPCLFFRDAPLTQRHTLCVHPDQLIALDVLIEAADDAIEVILIEMEEIHDNSDSPPMITKDSNIIQRFPVMMTDTSSIIINPFKVEKEGIYNILLTHTKDKTMTTTPTPIVDDYCLLIVSKLVRKATTEPSQLEENREQEVATAAIITPRQLMKQLFAIQGHHIDPIDADIAALKIKRSLRNDQYVSNCDGINTFDCFISYRVESDQEFALELYGLLKEMNFSVFLDKKCLKPGLPWKEGFLKGLQSSNYFIAIISSDGLKKVKDPTVDHRRDNLLLEYETALKISCTMSRPFIIPIFLGKREGNNVLKNFDEFDEMLYPDSLEPLMP